MPQPDPLGSSDHTAALCLCGRPDDAETNMVQCEKCLRYYHFGCADVSDSIADEDRHFICLICADRASTVVSSRLGRSSTSSSRTARAALDLQRLEEERQMEKNYLAKKYAILQNQLAESRVEGSVRSRRSRRSTQRTQDWVENQLVPTSSTSIGLPQIPAVVPSHTGTIPKEPPLVPASSSTTTFYIVRSPVGQKRVEPLTVRLTSIPERNEATCPTMRNLEAGRQDSGMPVSAQLIDEAAGGSHAISSGHRDPPTVVDFNISPTPTPDELTRQMFDLQMRMDSLQRHLATKPSAQQCQPLSHVEKQGQQVPLAMPKRIQAYEFPTSSSVSQTCSKSLNAATTSAVPVSATSLSIFNSTPPNLRPSDSIDQYTPPRMTEPCSPPMINSFTPSHRSTPQSKANSPSVHTVSACLSPIVTPAVTHVTPNRIPFYGVPNPLLPFPPPPRPPPVPPPSPPPCPPPVPPPSPPPCPPQMFTGPNSHQLAARHVVPRELPIFSGDPVEWPLFLSSFLNSTEMCGYSEGENLMRFQRCLKGNALEAVRSYLMHPSSVPLILQTLKTLYGRPELIINSLLAKVRATPNPKPERLETLISFGLACKNLCQHLQAAGLQSHLANPLLLQELVEKLPVNIKLNWSLFKRNYPVVDLSTFGGFMNEMVNAASDVTYTHETDGQRVGKQDKPKAKEKMFVNTHAAEESKTKQTGSASNSDRKQYQPKPCNACQKEGHKIQDCNTFHGMTLADRWKLVQERRLCRRCLHGHGKFPCKAGLCGENGCDERHHKLLHPGKPEPPKTNDVPKTTSSVAVHRQYQQSILFRVIPVTLYGDGKSLQTYAFLDDGSSTTLVESATAKKLGISGNIHPLCLQWTSDIERTEGDSQLIRMEISGQGNSRRHVLKKVHTVKNLNLPSQSLDYSEVSKQFPHLRGLPVNSYESASPTILIGLDNSSLMSTLKLREGSRGDPMAAKTRLGWTIYGTVPAEAAQAVHRQFHICATSPAEDLHNLVKGFFSVEGVGSIEQSAMESDDERRARQILETTTRRTASGRFEVRLLWKYDYIEFPNSKPMAEKRLRCLERRLASKPELYEKVKQQIQQYQVKGYAHKASSEEIRSFDPRRTWYLPLNVVTNPKKPDKVRLVFDAAAQVQGQSLNSALLTGPDLLAPLPSVLCPFRQFEVAISADIAEMFHQLLMYLGDKSALLFLWRDAPSKPFEVFVMDVAIFGASCSPSAAQFVKNLNAQEFAEQYPLAAKAIIKHHYVDDFVYSTDTVEEAVELAQQVKEVHSKAGFTIRNWLSNSPEVLSRVGDQKMESSKCFEAFHTAAYQRVLGMTWKPDPDVFVFQGLFSEEVRALLHDCIIPTKRQALRVVLRTITDRRLSNGSERVKPAIQLQVSLVSLVVAQQRCAVSKAEREMSAERHADCHVD